jgi:hypothetical protein
MTTMTLEGCLSTISLSTNEMVKQNMAQGGPGHDHRSRPRNRRCSHSLIEDIDSLHVLFSPHDAPSIDLGGLARWRYHLFGLPKHHGKVTKLNTLDTPRSSLRESRLEERQPLTERSKCGLMQVHRSTTDGPRSALLHSLGAFWARLGYDEMLARRRRRMKS